MFCNFINPWTAGIDHDSRRTAFLNGILPVMNVNALLANSRLDKLCRTIQLRAMLNG